MKQIEIIEVKSHWMKNRFKEHGAIFNVLVDLSANQLRPDAVLVSAPDGWFGWIHTADATWRYVENV